MTTLSDLKVVRVMSGCDFNTARTLVKLSVFVSDNGYSSADKGKKNILTDKVLVSFVLGVDCDCRIAQKRFGSGRGYFNIASSADKRIADMPEEAVLLLKLNLSV